MKARRDTFGLSITKVQRDDEGLEKSGSAGAASGDRGLSDDFSPQ